MSAAIEIFFNMRREILYVQAATKHSIYYINTNEIPNFFTLIVFCCERCELVCGHNDGDLFTCEDMFLHESSPGISLAFI